MTTREFGLREAREILGPLANRADLAGEITYLTRNGRRIAAIVPLDRIKEAAVTTIYVRITDEGTESIAITQNGNEIREVYVVDDQTVDDSVVYDGTDPDEYLRRRDMELVGEGYTQD